MDSITNRYQLAHFKCHYVYLFHFWIQEEILGRFFCKNQTNGEVNIFRHLKMRFLHSECMFWKYLNRSAKRVSTIDSKCKNVKIFIRNNRISHRGYTSIQEKGMRWKNFWKTDFWPIGNWKWNINRHVTNYLFLVSTGISFRKQEKYWKIWIYQLFYPSIFWNSSFHHVLLQNSD